MQLLGYSWVRVGIMHKLVKLALLALGTSTLGAAIGISESRAEADRLQEERECEEALRKNSVRALEQFLRRYPYGNSACRALALNALGEQDESKERGGGGNNNGYNR